MSCNCGICGYRQDSSEDYGTWPQTIEKARVYPITDTGKPTGHPLAFICAKCLRHANRMRFHIKSLFANVDVTADALRQFMSFRSIHRIPDSSAPVAIVRMFQHAVPLNSRVSEVDPQSAQYEHRLRDGWVFVATTTSPARIVEIRRARDHEHRSPPHGNKRKHDRRRKSQGSERRANRVSRREKLEQLRAQNRRRREKERAPRLAKPDPGTRPLFRDPKNLDSACVDDSHVTPAERAG
jgi:hypothetical protein